MRDGIANHRSDGRGRGVPIVTGNDNNGNAVPVLGEHVGSPSKDEFCRHLSYRPNWAYLREFCTGTTLYVT